MVWEVHGWTKTRLAAAFNVSKLVVLLGTEDTDPNHPELRKTAEAEAQGPHRWARGHKFYEEAKRRAAKLGVPFAWKLGTAPGVAHSDKGMSMDYRGVLIFGK